MLRLDKYMTATGLATRKETALLVKAGRITVNGIPPKRPDLQIDPLTATVCLDGAPIVYKDAYYIMMHKPRGVVSATEDPGETTVLDLLPERERRLSLFPCGRLDKNTTGLVLLTSDGPLSHKLLSPKRHVKKEYRFTVKYPLSDEDITALSQGVTISSDSHAEEWHTAPCTVSPDEDRMGGVICLDEGKYHQIKRMMEAVHNRITSLARISFAGIPLDPTLAPGEWRHLTEEEEAHLKQMGM